MEESIIDEQLSHSRPRNYAGFLKRLVAIIIDGILLGVVLSIVSSLLGFGYESPQGNSLSIVLNWLYFAGMESSMGQATLGKKAMGIIVTDMDGRQISFWNATGRYFAKIVSAIILLIGFFMAGFTEKKQALHDILARTLVVDN